jgi:hypothetical protein
MIGLVADTAQGEVRERFQSYPIAGTDRLMVAESVLLK